MDWAALLGVRYEFVNADEETSAHSSWTEDKEIRDCIVVRNFLFTNDYFGLERHKLAHHAFKVRSIPHCVSFYHPSNSNQR